MRVTWILLNGRWTNGAGVSLKCMPVQPFRSYEGRSELPEDVVKEAYKEYAAQYGTEQSLERLNERGGFTWSELAILLYERIKRIQQSPVSEEVKHG